MGLRHAAAEHQMQHFTAIEARVQHSDADRHHRVGLCLETVDQRAGVGHVGGDDLRVTTLMLRVELVQVLGQTGGVVLRNREHDGLAGAGVLLRGEFRVALPRQTVELSRIIRRFVSSLVHWCSKATGS